MFKRDDPLKMAYAEDEPEPERRSFMFRGYDLSKVLVTSLQFRSPSGKNTFFLILRP
jgi:hypothetical protein